MHQTHSIEPNARWMRVVRDSYDLSPNQLRVLVAIVVYEAIHRHSPTVSELNEMADEQPTEYRFSTTGALAQLSRQGLVERHGATRDVRYGPTVTGVRRAMRP